MMREHRAVLLAVAGIVLAFLFGFVWQNLRARDFERRMEAANVELTFERLQSRLSAAVIEAEHGNYEIARQLASDFFTGLNNDIARAPAESQQALRAIAGHRDAIITAASRSDPQTGSLLFQLYNTFRVTFGDAPISPPRAAPAPVTSTTTQ